LALPASFNQIIHNNQSPLSFSMAGFFMPSIFEVYLQDIASHYMAEQYQIKLDQFEGPFDLLLFFIERDELDIYNIPITTITNDFLQYIHQQEHLSIELGSEFILFVSTLMRIKAKMLLPRKELDDAGNEIDPRQELVDKILEYKRFKEASLRRAIYFRKCVK
jgi:hypothetical protein